MKWMPLLALLLPGCTAARASYLLLDAQQQYQDALAEGAEQHAPYEITLAREFLDKAKEEDGYSDYGATEMLCRKSVEYAAAAFQKAQDRPPVDHAEDIVPEEKKERAPEETDDRKIELDDL